MVTIQYINNYSKDNCAISTHTLYLANKVKIPNKCSKQGYPSAAELCTVHIPVWLTSSYKHVFHWSAESLSMLSKLLPVKATMATNNYIHTC